MNQHEEAAVRAFVDPYRQERFLNALANPRKRSTFTEELHHLHSRFLQSCYIRPLKKLDSLPKSVYKTLRALGAPERCWAIGGRFDGSEVELLRGLTDSGDGFLLSCIPGKLAFVRSEDEKFVLSRL